MADREAYEPGNKGRIYSLGGVPGAVGNGQIARQFWETVTGPSYERDIMPANPMRTWAIIQNTHASPGNIYVVFGGMVQSSIELAPGDAYVIDRDHPWIGSIGMQNPNMADCFTVIIEMSLARAAT